MTAATTATTRRAERPAPVVRTAVRRDAKGKVLGTVELAPELFGIEPNDAVLHQVVTAQLAAARAGTQSTKTRAEVRGGGAKPYRQKGTGRARQGSIRSPLWTGGGVALGPKPRSYRQRTPKKMVRLALCSALSDRAAAERVAVVDTWAFDVPKTKDAIAALEALELEGRVLVVLERDDEVAAKSFRNLESVHTVPESELSAYDILRSDWVVFTDATLPGAGSAAEKALPVTRAPSKATAVAPSSDEPASGAVEDEDAEDAADTDTEAEPAEAEEDR